MVPQWPQNSSAASSSVPQWLQYFTLANCGWGFWVVAPLRLDSMTVKITANTTTIAATAASEPVGLVFSEAAEEPEVVRLSLIAAIWLVEFAGVIERVVIELVVICSVVVVGGEYGTTSTLNSTWAEATTAPFIEAIKYALTCNTQVPKVVGAVALLVIDIVKVALTGA